MPSYSRRDALKTIPALAAGLAGCASLTGRDDSLPMPTAWTVDVRTPTRAVRPPSGPLLVGTESQFRDDPMVSALDPATGEERWAVTGGKGRRSPLGFDDRHAYLFSRAERATAVDYEAGERAWSTELTGVDRPDPGVVQYPPAVAGDTVVVPISGVEHDVVDRLLGLSREEGDRRFRADLPASLAGAPAPVPPGDGSQAGVVAPVLDGTLRRFATDGSESWRVDAGPSPSSVTVAGDTVFVGSATEELLALDAATGEVRWRAPLQNTVFSRPLVADGRVYVGGADYFLYAFDAASGTRLWRDELAAPVTRGPTRVDDRLVTVVGSDILVRGHSGTVPFDPTALYVHATDGTLVDEQLFERTPDGGRVNWAVAAGGGVYVGQEWQLARLAPEVLDAE
ncbi:PQQ-binding-like beta-propeller repeat protein [Haloferax volcanii]|uniref:PQQ-binding-like beta-propeller repeat protein n=1 Tax=Haloferax volcanii TaxID=2246 RepID=UPI002499CF83|nr:PQQ-binding-like beta-propeller repeat protein [Haloferax alexandrinus]